MLNPESVARLARDLISRGGDVVGQIAVDAREARALVQVSPDATPVEFVVDLRGLERFIATAHDSARDVFPDVDLVEGGLRLVSEHLWEEIGSADAKVLAVGVDRDGQTWRRTEAVSPGRSIPAADYRWTADRDGS
ncbi:hypothetical protein ACIGB8_01160 [Promicromonospora sukumoe]|uniref:hypothetical protein n=1 Tax=Promicromonospora sukumoe TaxID=88382 RepID=UPI0037C98366